MSPADLNEKNEKIIPAFANLFKSVYYLLVLGYKFIRSFSLKERISEP